MSRDCLPPRIAERAFAPPPPVRARFSRIRFLVHGGHGLARSSATRENASHVFRLESRPEIFAISRRAIARRTPVSQSSSRHDVRQRDDHDQHADELRDESLRWLQRHRDDGGDCGRERDERAWLPWLPGSLSLNTLSTTLMEITGSTTGLHDQVVSTSSVVYGGLLQLVMSGIYVNGTSFPLFQFS